MIAAWCGHHHMKPLQHSRDKLSGGSRVGTWGPWSPLFLNQTEARRAKKNILETAPPPPQLSAKGLDLPLILCFAFQLNVLCLIVPCFCVSVKSFASVFLPHVAQAEEMILANSWRLLISWSASAHGPERWKNGLNHERQQNLTF